MKNELATVNNGIEKITFTEDQVNLIRQQIAPKATPAELQLFLYQCKRTGLDPLTRQIYAIHRRAGQEDKMTIQTSIDGFRVIAERSGVYAGQDKPLFGAEIDFEYNTSEWVNGSKQSTLKKRKVPEYAEVTVYKFHAQQRYAAATGIAYWDEYYPGASMGAMWHKMPHTMLAKCAESIALRKAFPQDLSGLYTGDEIPDNSTEDVVAASIETKLPALTEKLYIKALGRIATGEEGVMDNLRKAFTISEEQNRGLMDKIELVKQQAHEQAAKNEEELVLEQSPKYVP